MRKRFGLVCWAICFGVLSSMLWIPAAHAYIDPGSGSIIFQAAVGAALALGVGVKVFWRRIMSILSIPWRRRAREAETASGRDDNR
jgi:hypothetical protein